MQERAVQRYTGQQKDKGEKTAPNKEVSGRGRQGSATTTVVG